MEELRTDILIIGGGGAALLAALRATERALHPEVTVVSKGLLGKSGCTRMVQGGYNVVLYPQDSFEHHLRDTLRGGGYLNNQELAWPLVTEAPLRLRDLENRYGCLFDRGKDGRIHQRALAGQSFDRTVHKGDLTGIELMNRLSEQVLARPIRVLEEVRGIDLIRDPDSGRVAGALLLDMRRGVPILARAKAVLLATGGAAPLYRITAASLEKSGDGMGMAFRAGAEFVDMEMMQFHPTGLMAGRTRLTGTVLEEGLRGLGGRLFNATGERFMERYDPERLERSTRDRVARAGFLEIMAGRGTPNGGVYLDVSHLDADLVVRTSPGMVRRCLEVGVDLTQQPVEVTPTAHFQMGGIRIDPWCHTSIEGLFSAGEDAGGVHGANRLGGNGVVESIVFGTRAGQATAEFVAGKVFADFPIALARDLVSRIKGYLRPDPVDNAFLIRDELGELAWQELGLVRTESGLRKALEGLEGLTERGRRVRVRAGRQFNHAWNEALNLENLLIVARMIGLAALERAESRGSHFRADHPQTDNKAWLCNIRLLPGDGYARLYRTDVEFTHFVPSLPETVPA